MYGNNHDTGIDGDGNNWLVFGRKQSYIHTTVMHIIQELIDKFEYTVKMLCDKKMLLKMKGTYVVHLTKGWYLSYTEKSS